jgi:hypothetical protein
MARFLKVNLTRGAAVGQRKEKEKLTKQPKDHGFTTQSRQT